jgi:hypothetical protein
LGFGKSLIGLGLKKFKKPWAWSCPKKISTPVSSMSQLALAVDHYAQFLLFINFNFFSGCEVGFVIV